MRALAVVVTTLALAPPAVAAQSIRATLTTSTPTPVVDHPWRYTVTVRSAAGRPLAARMRLQILVGGTIVGCWRAGRLAQCLDGSPGNGSRSAASGPAS